MYCFTAEASKIITLTTQFCKMFSGCLREQEGCCIITEKKDDLVFGINRVYNNFCQSMGCRIPTNPIHSLNCRSKSCIEDAITRAFKKDLTLKEASIYLTYIPDEADCLCICSTTIAFVYYAGNGILSEKSKSILSKHGIKYTRASLIADMR